MILQQMGLRASALYPTRCGNAIGLRISAGKRHTNLSQPQIDELDALTRAISTLFDVPICLVTLFTGRDMLRIVNTVARDVVPTQMHSKETLCAKLLLPSRPEALVVSDATHDRRFKNLPGVVGGPMIRSYMGVPLVTDQDTRIGSLCIIDKHVRSWSAEDLSLVANLSHVVVEILQNSPSTQALALCDVAQEGWILLYTNRTWTENWGHHTDFWSARRSPDLSTEPWVRYRSRISQGCKFTVKSLSRGGHSVTTLLFTPASIPATDITIPSLPAGESSKTTSLYIITSLTQEETLDLRGPPSHVPGMECCSIGPMVGRGGYGTVHLGVWHGENVAVKVVPIDHNCGKPWSEAIIMDDLRHPNLVTLHDWVTTPSEIFIVMELCHGGCLRQAIDRGDIVDLQTKMKIAQGIASGMAHLHELGIVHADLNCNNILLDDRGTPKVADFGLSRMLAGQITTETLGTLTHAPLELLVTGALTLKTDVYAFGVVLWEIFDQRRAFAGMTRDQITFAKIQHHARFDVQAGVPDGVTALIHACTDPEPRGRPPFTRILQRLCDQP